ncbi:helix-turn-helix domain-containing protein [Ruminococcaceae bacterium OttesenSCG-928-A16]|nr:helix-turn-helix domain-containing protein [Ruminococcaceae bacterium OttesenSCG-928-A16]
MQIVTEISDILQQHVNLMDENGIIVASTDSRRLNTFHEGAATVIKGKLSELIITADTQFEGSRKGINLPVMQDDEIVGVIGITGEYDEVVKYGQVIKKMTEILLRENLMNQQKKIDDRIRTRFLDEWILDDAPPTAAFVQRGVRLGLDITVPYRVMVAIIADIKRYTDTPEGQVLIDKINRRLRRWMAAAPGQIFAKTPSRAICLFPALGLNDARLLTTAQALQRCIQEEFGIQMLVGIDGGAATVPEAYQQATKAVMACNPKIAKTVCLYNNINLEIFSDEVSVHTKKEFIRRIFRDIPEDELSLWVPLLQAYFDANGSISQAAERLFLHKNTLQYRLKKLYQITGYNPRNMQDATLFVLAIQFYAQIEGS